MYLQQYPIILASKSPRRQELMKLMGFDFTTELRDVDESYPTGLTPAEIAVFIAERKAEAFEPTTDQIVVTADTIVALDEEILGKPENVADAKRMLRLLSGRAHEVYTGVCLTVNQDKRSFFDVSTVFCRTVTEEEIAHYINQFKPFDKAGSYGIQDWWGLTVVRRIEGSYTNVMGLPTEKLYTEIGNL